MYHAVGAGFRLLSGFSSASCFGSPCGAGAMTTEELWGRWQAEHATRAILLLGGRSTCSLLRGSQDACFVV